MDNAAADRVLRVITLLCPERRLNRLLRLALESDGFCIDGLDGLEVCRRVRGFSTVPIIMLTARAAEHARVEVRRGDHVLALSPTEYRLLVQLAREAARVMLPEELLVTVWGPEYRDESQHVRLYISRLRKKLERDPDHPSLILTKPGIGYLFANPD